MPTPEAFVAIINNSYPFASSILLDTLMFLTTLSPLKPDTLNPLFFIASRCSSHISITKISLLFLERKDAYIDPIAPAPITAIFIFYTPLLPNKSSVI